MEKGNKIYEGKAKILYETDSREFLIQHFKDEATAFDATKRGTIKDKGICNNKISAKIFQLLESEGIPTHFVKLLTDREMLIKRLKIIPTEVTIRNVAAGGICKSLGLKEGTRLDSPVLEYHYKNDSLHDPLINQYHIKVLRLAFDREMEIIRSRSFEINKILIDFFGQRDLDLVDFKLEFGSSRDDILLGDEISPDTCRLWEKRTQRKMDKDRFRQDLGQIEEVYQEVLRRVIG